MIASVYVIENVSCGEEKRRENEYNRPEFIVIERADKFECKHFETNVFLVKWKEPKIGIN